MALFAGGINSNGACDTIDVVQYIDDSNCNSYQAQIKLQRARYNLVGTSVVYNGVRYAVFAGGQDGDVVCNDIDVFYFDEANDTIKRLENVPFM